MLRRLARPALAAAALATLVVALPEVEAEAPPGAARLCGDGSDAVLRDGRWTTVAKPEELSRIRAHATGGENEKLLLVSDGKRVMRSTNGGCSWSEAYDVQAALPETPVEDVVPHATALFIPEGGSRQIIVVEGVGKAAAARVLVSDGDGFREASGLPALTGYRDITSAPDDPSLLYLWTGAVDPAGDVDPAGASGQLYRSEDGGESWTFASTGPQIERLAVDPVDAKDVWAVRANGTVAMSTDFGASFNPVGMPPPRDDQLPVVGERWLDIAHFRRRPLLYATVVFAAPTRQADVSRAVASFDQGQTWQELSTDGLGPVGGLFFGNDQSQLFTANGSTATSWRGPGLREFVVEDDRWKDADAFGLVSLFDPRPARFVADGIPQRAVWMRRDHPLPEGGEDVLARFQPPPPGPRDYGLTGREKCGGTAAAGLPDRDVRFEPPGLDIRLEPGQPHRQEIKAQIDAEPTPVDTFFLLDHSSSTDDAVSGLNCSITRLVTDLPESNFDMSFGLGGYNDMVTYTYRRLVDITPAEKAGPIIAEELRRLNTLRGTQEPLRGALFQTATGAGLDVRVSDDAFTGVGPAGNQNVHRKVEPGQQANFRDDVLRTVFVITDEPYGEQTEGEPAYSDVIAALTRRDIKVIGLPWEPPIKPEDANPEADHAVAKRLQLRQQLTNIARDTGAVAPRGGVDCDGGGSPDIPEGQPIVCPLPESGLRAELDDTLVSVLRSLSKPNVQPVKLVPRKTGGLSVTVEGPDPEPRDVRKPNLIQQPAVISCTEEQAGKRYDIEFDLEVAGKVVDTLKGVAQCGEAPAVVVPPKKPPTAAKGKPKAPAVERPAPAEPPAEPAPAPAPATPPAPQPAVAVAPPPPPPAPAPVSPVPAQAPAPAQAMAPSVGAAMQDEPEVAVKAATVSTADRERGPSTARDYAMVSSRPAVPVPAMVTLGVGLSGLFVFIGLGVGRRRRSVVPAVVEVREQRRR